MNPESSDRAGTSFRWKRLLPPRRFWLIPLMVALLRSLPFVVSSTTPPAEGQTRIPIGYNLIDSFVYASFVRQASEHTSFTLANLYTTAPQDGRYVLPLFTVLGGVCQVTRLAPFHVLEWFRVPMIFLFFGTLWWFLIPIFSSTRDRMFASVLVAFSGGIEYLVMPFVPHFPAEVADVTGHDLSNLFGWHTFASCYNPLWLAGLTGTLLTLRPLFEVQRQASPRLAVHLGLGAVITYLLHPYSGLVVVAVIALFPGVVWFSGRAQEARKHLLLHALALLIFGVVVGALSGWQNRDVVYRLTAQNVFGKWDVPVFWYPVGLGAAGLLALIGWRDMIRARAPIATALAAWTLSVMALHTSPVLNGFHFIFHLHLPVCLAAAVPFRQFWDSPRPAGSKLFLRWMMGAALFTATLHSTYITTTAALTFQKPADSIRLAIHLQSQPRGHVWAPPDMGNFIPAYSGQFVHAGHWFLTPEWRANKSLYEAFTEGEMRTGEIAKFFDHENIRYAVLPKRANAKFVEEVASLAEARNDFGEHDLFLIGEKGK